MSNDVQLTIQTSPIPLKYVGETGVQSLPCIVSDMIDIGVLISDGRYSDEAVWEGEGAIISPAIPDGTVKTYAFTHIDLSPADSRYIGSLTVDFSTIPEMRYASISVLEAPGVMIDPAEIGTYQPGAICPYASRKQAAQLGAYAVVSAGGGSYRVQRTGGPLHQVRVCIAAGIYHADCDCHDWTAYGAGFHRACIHIWRVILTQAVGVC